MRRDKTLKVCANHYSASLRPLNGERQEAEPQSIRSPRQSRPRWRSRPTLARTARGCTTSPRTCPTASRLPRPSRSALPTRRVSNRLLRPPACSPRRTLILTLHLAALCADANLFKKAFNDAQENNKKVLSGSGAEAPTPVESDAPVAADATSVTQTGAPVEKGKEVSKEAEAEGDKLPEYKDEGVAPPPEKTEVVQGEKVSQATDEVRRI